MRAFQIPAAGEAPDFRDLPQPHAGPGMVGVRIRACGLNFADRLMILGRYQDMPEPPFTLGLELAGLVDAVGDGVTGFRRGDRVAVFAGSGGLAEYGVFPADRCLPIPKAMPLHEAAGFQVVYGTSHLALTRRARLAAGETLLVLGAAGGVGLTAVEIGKALGARVIAAARGAARLEVARRAGADHLIDTDTGDLKALVRALGGADVVYDPVGGAAFTAALGACNAEARIVVIGFASGDVPPVPANILLVKNVDVQGFYWGGYLRFAPEALRASLGALLALYQAGRLHPHVSHTYPLDRAPEALEMLASRAATGKIVVTIPEPDEHAG